MSCSIIGRVVTERLSASTSSLPGASRPAYALRALGKRDLPSQVVVAGKTYVHSRTVKHDFYAATGFYFAADDPHEQVVLKIGRTEEFAGVPLKWLGRRLCDREVRIYEDLSDLPNIPPLLGRVGETGFVHRLAPGRPLKRNIAVPDGFFEQLQELLAELHRRGIAYLDTNKLSNIVLGDDGRPHLIDFQISWDERSLPPCLRAISRWWLRRMQREDLYHVLKHKRRLRPDELSDDERTASHPSWLIRTHRAIIAPYKNFRRRIFARLRESGRLVPEGSE
jgi:hypothetical protein